MQNRNHYFAKVKTKVSTNGEGLRKAYSLLQTDFYFILILIHFPTE